VVCDPPYELGFMGKSWDGTGVAYQVKTWLAAYRVLKPGGHLLAFGGSRTYHRMACSVEDAGFEIRDQIMWLYGSGFPKSLDVSKAIDKAAGRLAHEGKDMRYDAGTGTASYRATTKLSEYVRPTPATDAARQWQGWGTALKPAHEPIVVARKPLIGTVAANVLKHGTGALNVDGCRVGHDEPTKTATRTAPRYSGRTMAGGKRGGIQSDVASADPQGRWPANVILDDDAGAMLDEQQEGASRFFYCPKASRKEREAGLREAGCYEFRVDGSLDGKPTGKRKNHHPTVKPVALMRYLIRLVTPPGGTVLDPFLGSGTTLMAAALEGVDAIGIEREAEYVEIAKARVAWVESQPVQMSI